MLHWQGSGAKMSQNLGSALACPCDLKTGLRQAAAVAGDENSKQAARGSKRDSNSCDSHDNNPQDGAPQIFLLLANRTC